MPNSEHMFQINPKHKEVIKNFISSINNINLGNYRTVIPKVNSGDALVEIYYLHDPINKEDDAYWSLMWDIQINEKDKELQLFEYTMSGGSRNHPPELTDKIVERIKFDTEFNMNNLILEIMSKWFERVINDFKSNIIQCAAEIVRQSEESEIEKEM